MKVEVRCPDCNSPWHVDESVTGEMVCPKCLTRIPLDGSTTVGIADPDRAVAVDSEPVGAVSPDAPGGPSVTEATPDWMYNEVVCPRCSLHFQPRRRPEASTRTRKTILVVDDLAYFRQIAKDALEPTFVVLTAANRSEARSLISTREIDLLVLDLTLDGFNAGRALLSELSPKSFPILIFTAQDESEMYGENWDELKRLGADDLVIKGMKVAESLLRKASTLLGVPVDEEHAIG